MGRSAATELLMLEDDTDDDDDNYYMSDEGGSESSTEDEDGDAQSEVQAQQQPLTTDAQALTGDVLQLYAIKNGCVTIQSPKSTATVDPATSRKTSVRIGVEQEPGPTHDWSKNWLTAIGPEPAQHRYRVCLYAPGNGKQLSFVIMPTPVERQMIDDLLKKAATESISKQASGGSQADKKTPDTLVNGIRSLLLSVSDPASKTSLKDLPAWAQETIQTNAGGYVYSTTLLKQTLAASKRKLKNKVPATKADESEPARKPPSSSAGPKVARGGDAEPPQKTTSECNPTKAEQKSSVKRSLPFNEKTKATRDLGCSPLTVSPATKRRRFTVSLELTTDQLVQVEALLDSK